ncbi:TPA: hypothetical protein JD854_RS09050 [Citrobacter amalonaticus]|uniref:Uncharacterized protein n=1 Tax=Citrobacter amalonaticus TaxID=35703 RepID=A0A9C7QJH2_CITAM|nr:hypothetical protein [Citrobacter amalonaticus]
MDKENSKLPGVNESQHFLNFEEKFHKIGFVVLLVIILLALAGFFSGGYFSAAVKENANNTAHVEYERFGRLQTEFKLKIVIPLPPSPQTILRIGGDFNTAYETETLWPRPDRMYSHGSDLYLVYNTLNNQKDATVWLRVMPVKPGYPQSVVQLNHEPEIHFRQFIYP